MTSNLSNINLIDTISFDMALEVWISIVLEEILKTIAAKFLLYYSQYYLQ